MIFRIFFSNESKRGSRELERKIKTVLLMLEKDLELQYRFPVLISRPRSMFSKSFVVIDESIEKNLLNSRFGKYFNKIASGRQAAIEGSCTVTDIGDIYLMNLRGMWEDYYPEKSFAGFKYELFSNSDNLNFKYKGDIYPRYKISINSKYDIRITDLKHKLIHEMEKINAILDEYKDRGKMFSIQDFSGEINKLYNNKEKSLAIASSYIDLISPLSGEGKFMRQPIEFNKSKNKYRIVNRTYNNAIRDYVIKSDIIRKMNKNLSSLEIYYPMSSKKDFNMFRPLYLLELFDLCSYEILGGQSPEIFLRINDPFTIKRITSENYNYSNQILKTVRRRHENSTQIMRKFFTELNSDEVRWGFIEDYFLGYDVLEKEYNLQV